MVNSIDAEKHGVKFNTFCNKNFQQIRSRKKFPQCNKSIYEKPTGNFLLSRKTKNISSKVGNKASCPLWPLLFNVV